MYSTQQFLIYKLVLARSGIPGKMDKIPTCPHTLTVGIDPTDPKYWADYQTALSMAELAGPEYGLAFSFTENDPYFFIDIDGAMQEDGTWSPLSTSLCAMFPGAYVEVSQSGTGAHIIGRYTGEEPNHKCKNTPLHIELYTSGRFCALTGKYASGDPESDHTSSLFHAIVQYWQPAVAADAPDVEWADQADPEWAGPESDEELIELALNSKSASSVFGNKASIKDLWTGNDAVLCNCYPSERDSYDRSTADAALAQHLAFWTGKNPVRMDRLMRQSALYREKWDSHTQYMNWTVSGAAKQQEGVYYAARYDKKKQQDLTPLESIQAKPLRAEAEFSVGDQFLTPSLQMDYFRGCVYVRDIHKIWVPDGSFLKPDQFKATYGGYVFSLDAHNQKVTKSAWEVFTESQAIRFPKAARTVFRPELPSGSMIEEEGISYLNTYVPVETPRKEGDPAPFVRHLEKVFPDPTDRRILLSYMAACVQYPGVKFQWCPLLQGAEGNGKTLFTRCIAYAVGDRYTHLPNAKELGEGGAKFTTWIQNKLFIGVEEIYVSDRREVSEALKVFITNDRIEIQGKGVDQVMGDNRANFLMCSNHKDALHVSLDSRRYAIFYSAQQSKADKQRDGMGGDYFPKLYHWLKREDGYAIVNNFLQQYAIEEEYNPATLCQEAPETSSTREAVEVSMGSVEQEILEAIDEGRPGFSGGWISSKKLDDLMTQLRANRRIPINKRRALLQSLGYDWHPNLVNGRANCPIAQEDGAKPKLFIRIGHINSNLQGPEIINRYYKDQGYVQFDQVRA